MLDGVKLFDDPDGADVPDAFVAFTVNVYAVPPVRPDTLNGLLAPVPVKLPGLLVTVYPVMVPVPLGAVNGTEAVVPVSVTVPIVGALGIVNTETAEEADDIFPLTLVAVNVML